MFTFDRYPTVTATCILVSLFGTQVYLLFSIQPRCHIFRIYF